MNPQLIKDREGFFSELEKVKVLLIIFYVENDHSDGKFLDLFSDLCNRNHLEKVDKYFAKIDSSNDIKELCVHDLHINTWPVIACIKIRGEKNILSTKSFFEITTLSQIEDEIIKHLHE